LSNDEQKRILGGVRQIIEILIKRGEELLKQPYKKIEFTGNPKADDLLNDLKNFPYIFVLA